MATTERLRGRANQQARRRLFASSPLCVSCKAKGRVTAATERDHIVPLHQGGEESPSNEQPLCHACHAEKSAREAGKTYKRKVRVWLDGYPTGGVG